MARLITEELVDAHFASGGRRLVAPRGEVIVTPNAWARASELGVLIDQTAAAMGQAPAAPAPVDDAGGCERIVDPSGLLVVRAKSVRLGKFTGAGANRNIGLKDLITGKDGSPMTAGLMSFGRHDSFPWTLDYDEVDLVLEGTLRLAIDGRALTGGPGDVFYVPKGSSIRFETPDHTRVFYVTYPADWAAGSSTGPGKTRPGGAA